MSTKVIRIIALLMALAGLSLLLLSPSLGEAAGQAILARHGGGMDTTVYLSQIQATISSYRIIGAILLGVGLFRSLQP